MSCGSQLDGREVALSPKEFRILELFMNHPQSRVERGKS
jgi:DNA-binding response OmpR family regulator